MKIDVYVLLAAFIVLATIVGLMSPYAAMVVSGDAAGRGDVLLGDVNGDGKVDSGDALQALRYAAEIIPDTALDMTVADVNGDGKVDSGDALLLLQYAAEIIDEFPAAGKPGDEPGDEPTTPPRKPATLDPTPVEDLTAATNAVINDNPDTFCNPINISYGYRDDADEGYREGADPMVQVFKGEYYLFVSHTFGYWWSKDLSNWEFISTADPSNPTAQEAEMDKWAPATCVVGDTMYLTHSQGGAIYKSDDPKSGKWTRVGQPVVWDDPAFWYDDDGYVYCYYGCSNVNPLYVVKLDPNNNMRAVGEPMECFYQNLAAHGFENPGDENQNTGGSCWMEGAWMIKHEGKYYLNYAGPGTEYASYADGCYVSDSPMGPFEYCASSPISYKPTGYLVGAGHGATFQDLWGNWWKVDTAAISQHSSWERRIELIPLTFDKNGNPITDTKFMDYPTYVPALIEDNFGDAAQPDWHLLSYNASVTTSSTLDAKHDGKYAVDESIRSWWSAKTGDADEWLQIDLGKLCAVNAVQVNFADQGATPTSGRRNTYCYNYLVEFSQDGETWYTLADHTGVTAAAYEAKDTSHDYYELVSAIGARYIRVTNKGAIPAKGKFALSGLRVFGNGQGSAPAAVSGVTVNRPVKDERTVTVKWDAADGAEGYIVRYGYDKDVLHQAYQVIGKTSVTIRMLNMGVDYWFTVDSYNDSGYTEGVTLYETPATVEAPANRPANEPLPPVETVIEGLPIYEAESATLGGAAIKSGDPGASDSYAVHNMHEKGAYLELSGVDGGDNGGSATLHFVYANGNSHANMDIVINGGKAIRYDLPGSGGWDKFVAVDIPIDGLNVGPSNTIRIVGGIDEGFNPDFIQILFS